MNPASQPTSRIASGMHAGNYPAPLWRRAAALLYDGLFVIALLMLATLILLPFNGGEALPQQGLIAWLYQGYLLFWVGAYFSLFWCIGGQTPGMKVWHIRVLMPATACYRTAVLRFIGGLCSVLLAGIPFWFARVDAEKRSLIDRWLGTIVTRIPKP
ncbi:MAG: RDD family protein [Halothiobacillus sp.]